MPYRERPRGVNLSAERTEEHNAPVADLVAEPLNDDRPVGWQNSGCLPFLVQEPQEVPSRPWIESVAIRQYLCCFVMVERSDLSRECTNRPAEFERSARRIAVPERHLGC